jgi:tetratricopeptide (TPR) repeat protein
MSSNRFVTGMFFTAVLLVSLWFPHNIFAGTCEQPVAVAVSVQGEVNVRKGDAKDWEPVRRKDAFCPGDTVRVMEESRADLLLINETTLRLDQNTEIIFRAPEREKEFWLDVLLGGTYFMSRTPRTFQVGTPFVNAGVEGTEFFIGVEKDRALLTVFEGRLTAANDAGKVTLHSGQSAVAEAGKAPVLRIESRPRDAVRWTLFYPVVAEARSGAPEGWQDRAAALLSVGRVEEAGAEIDETLRKAPDDPDALALQAVIAVAQNEKEAALDLAKKAVEAAPKSATARIALSYAQQAGFDLEGALSTLEEAVKIESENALARARLSELLLSFGRLDEALDEAKKAAGKNPGIARTQTVLGFAYLAQIRMKESRAAFEKAIGLDQADPLPRLGLGLAMIRDGDVEGGRKEIEIAASLDPNNSLIRSYLGKAYYEEKRYEFAATQFDMAKEFDPNDPTPFFYDAIRKQSVNRPVEALNDMQKAISLNDNRAIYRSRLLLDEDLAARSASLGRIYSDLGFQQLALVEGWKSVNTDPSNYSAHRFLADSYSALPRHEIARVSELLQSQLLQPININPVQPSLAQSNLFILEGAGPSGSSFNEFNPLFNRNRLALQASSVVGNNDTWGEEIVHSAVWNRFSYSLGQFHFETDGFRVNNDLNQDIYDLFVQGSISHKTSVQAEFRVIDVEKGDLMLNFDPDSFSSAVREDVDSSSIRVGFHHAFSPGSDLIGSAAYQNLETNVHDSAFFPTPPVLSLTFDDEIKDESISGELQHLFRSKRFHLISGAGYFQVDRDRRGVEVSQFPPAPPDPPFVDVSETDIRHTVLYLYSQIHYPRNVTLTVGASGDFYRNDFLGDRDQLNPKMGVSWTPVPSTTLRAAVFRTLKRQLVNDQTLEPTQVAGFNQFFDDAEGTRSWRYGAAVEHAFSENVYGGVEYSRRELDVPFDTTFIPPPPGFPFVVVDRVDWKERLGRGYLFWTPHPRLALSAEYQYERFERDSKFVAGIEDVETHKVPFGLGYFHPCGMFFRVKETYIDQDGKFLSQTTPFPFSGSDQFWLTDASVGYRLPERYGIFAVEAKNLFDESFRYQDTDPVSPVLQPERSVVFKFTLAL